MSASSEPDPMRVVIAGGGVAGLEALVALGSGRVRLDVTLVSPREHFEYRPEGVGDAFGLGRPAAYPLSQIAADQGALSICDTVVHVHPEKRTLVLASGDALGYDAALLAVGAIAYPAFEHGVTFDHSGDPASSDELLAELSSGRVRSVAVIVPHSVTWTLPAYELALLIAARGEQAGSNGVEVTVLTHEGAALQDFGPIASSAVANVLAGAGVQLVCGVRARPVSETTVRAGRRRLTAERIVSLPVVTGPHLPGAPHDALGFLRVDDRGFVVGADRLLAAGDGTNHKFKQGGLAAQQADVAATQIARLAGAELPDRRYVPVLRGLLRTPHGPLYMRAAPIGNAQDSKISDEPLWWPPSRMASRWLAPYLAGLDAARTTVAR